MANLVQNRSTITFGDQTIADKFNIPMAAATSIFAGAMVAVAGAGSANAGFAVNVVNPVPAGGLTIVGRADRQADNSGNGVIAGSGNGAAGNITVPVTQGIFKWDNAAAADALTAADQGYPCFATDNHTVARTDGAGVRPYAGIVQQVDSDGVWVETRQSLRKTGQIITLAVDLTALANGNIMAFKPGFRGCIERAEFIVSKAGTGAGANAAIQPRITPSGGAAAAVTGGLVTVTLANTTVGANVAGTTVTALNQFGEQDTIDFNVSGVTVFTAGNGTLVVYLA